MDALSPLPPWDQLSYFQTPREEVFVPPVGTPTQVATADPMRVLIAFGATSSAVFVATSAAVLAAGGGRLVSMTDSLWVLTHGDWGPLVGAAWWVSTDSRVTVWQVSLSKWPSRRQSPGAPDGEDASQRQSILSRALSVLRKGG